MKRLAILTVFVAVALVPLSADIAIVAGSHHAALVVKDTRFDPGLQLLSEVRAGIGASRQLERPIRLQIDGGLALGAVGSSSPVGGVVYRGLVTRGAWLSGGLVYASGLGSSLTARAVLSSYEWTTLIGVHAEAEFAIMLEVPVSERLTVQWAVPVFYQFRRDLQYAFGAGLRADLRLEVRSPS